MTAIRVNLFPNPNFNPDGMSSGVWDGNHAGEMPGDGTFVPSSEKGYAELILPSLAEDTEYVFSARSSNPKSQLTLWINGKQVFPKIEGDVQILRFVVQSGSQKDNRAVFPVGGVYSEPQLELASTYDAATSGGGLRFFAWNTMPLAS